MTKTLYICGNGFDLHHRLPTSYRDYRSYIKIHAPYLLEWFKEQGYLERSELWNDLETNMNVDFHNAFSDIYDECDINPNADGDKKWEELKYEIINNMSYLKEFTTTRFLEWINTVDVSIAKVFKDLQFAEGDSFITFNYTDTLQQVYGISNDAVFHIHGSLAKVRETANDEELHNSIQFGNDCILKHENYKEYENLYGHVDLYDVMIGNAVDEIVEIAKLFSKDISRNFEHLKKFIAEHGPFSEVVIMGHSLEGIDSGYYEKILIPHLKGCRWIVLCHGLRDEKNAKNFADSHKLELDVRNW